MNACKSIYLVELGKIKPQYGRIFQMFQFSSVQLVSHVWLFATPVQLQHARPPCPSQTPGIYSDSCPLSQWCHPAISSSVVPFSSCPQSFPESGSFPTSQLFAWGGQGIGVSALASVLPMNTQDWSPLGWTGWISLQPKGRPRVFSNTIAQKHQFLPLHKYFLFLAIISSVTVEFMIIMLNYFLYIIHIHG